MTTTCWVLDPCKPHHLFLLFVFSLGVAFLLLIFFFFFFISLSTVSGWPSCCLPCPSFDVCLDQKHFLKIRGDYFFSLLFVCVCKRAHPPTRVKFFKIISWIATDSEAQPLLKYQLFLSFATFNTTSTTSRDVTSCRSTSRITASGPGDNAAVAMVTERMIKWRLLQVFDSTCALWLFGVTWNKRTALVKAATETCRLL